MLKKFIILNATFSLFICLFFFNSMSTYALDVSAKSAILIEAKTGKVLFAKNEHAKMSMASTTKIMTALLALEYGDFNTEIIATKEMVTVEGTALGLRVGDKITLEGLVYGMMLSSGNDAANAAALTVDETTEDFAKMMNKRARSIGAKETNFVTPSGLDAEQHYSTAYDMALIAATAMENPKFKEIASSKTAKIKFGNPPKDINISNHNRLLKEYNGCIGIKTGFTKKSGRCLVSAVERDGIRLIAVTLNAPNDWNDHKSMFDYGFSLVQNHRLYADLSIINIPVVGTEKTFLNVVCQDSFDVPLLKDQSSKVTTNIYIDRFLYAPIKAGEPVGYIEYLLDGKVIEKTNILAATTIETNFSQDEISDNIFTKIIDFFKRIFKSD